VRAKALIALVEDCTAGRVTKAAERLARREAAVAKVMMDVCFL